MLLAENSHKEHKLAFRWPISRGAKLTVWIIPSCLVASIRRIGCGAEDKLGLSFVASLIIPSKPFRQICPVGPIYSEIYYRPIWTREGGKRRRQFGEINRLVFRDDRDDVSDSIWSWSCLQESDFCLLDENKRNLKRCLETISNRLQQCEELLNKAVAPDPRANTNSWLLLFLRGRQQQQVSLSPSVKRLPALHIKVCAAQQDAFWQKKKSTPSSNPQGSGGDSVPVTCGLKPSLPPSPHLMSENQVMLFSCCSCCPPGSARLQEHLPEGFELSGGRQTRGSWASSKLSSPSEPRQTADRLSIDLAPPSGSWGCLQYFSIYLFFFLFSPPRLLLCFAVTMVLFLVGITVAVNNSSHDNQTAGK